MMYLFFPHLFWWEVFVAINKPPRDPPVHKGNVIYVNFRR